MDILGLVETLVGLGVLWCGCWLTWNVALVIRSDTALTRNEIGALFAALIVLGLNAFPAATIAVHPGLSSACMAASLAAVVCAWSRASGPRRFARRREEARVLAVLPLHRGIDLDDIYALLHDNERSAHAVYVVLQQLVRRGWISKLSDTAVPTDRRQDPLYQLRVTGVDALLRFRQQTASTSRQRI